MGISFAQLRDLDTSALTTAADSSVAVGKDMETRAGEITEAARTSTGSDFWEGADAEAQRALLNTFPPPLTAASGIFKSSAKTIDDLVTELEAAKSALETAISSYPRLIVGDDGSVIWPPTNSAEDAADLQRQAQELAGQIKAALDQADTADTAAADALGRNNLGPGGQPLSVRLPDGSVYLVTGDGDDEIQVSTDADGNVVAKVGDQTFVYPPGTNLVINSRGGDDTVNVSDTVNSGLTVSTGDGTDTVTDHNSQGPRTFVTGEGNDTVASTGDNRNVFTEGGDDTLRSIGAGNNLASGAGNDSIQTTGGRVFAGAGDDEIRAGGHDDPFFRGRPEHATDIYGGAGRDRITGSDQGETIIGGGGDDTVDGRGGADRISGNTGDDTIQAGDGDDLVAAGDGDDTVDGGAGNDLIEGGTGDDLIEARDGDDQVFGDDGEDKIYGHDGNDVIDGGADEDYIDGQDGDDVISGGDGKDTIYGLDGNDVIDGGAGRDYLEGGRDNDVISGGTEEDVISGGRGDDLLSGGDGDDVMYAGDGVDTLDGGAGGDRAFVQDGDTVAPDEADTVEKVAIVDNSFIQVEGSEDFQDRIRADLDMYSSSPTGRQMMENLADRVHDTHTDWLPGEREIVISEFDEENGTASTGGGSWSDVEININPEFHLSDPGEATTDKTYREGVPSAILYHELAHGYDYLNGTSLDGDHSDGSPNSERQAAGLPTVDHDNDPNTPLIVDPDHPLAFTENGLRLEMGRDYRDAY